MIIFKSISSFFKLMTANHLRGIRFRTRFAIICASFFLLIDALFVAYNYHLLPNIVPSFYDADGIFIKAEQKSVFVRYIIELAALLTLTILISWIMKPWFKTPIIYARTRCLLFDITNLYITSVVSIIMILLIIAKGEKAEELSYWSQAIIFFFWTIVMVVEYIFDLKKLRKSI